MKVLSYKIFSLISLILLFPLIILICLFVYIEDKGLFFFTQIRVGQWGKEFNLYKFRTMSPVKDSLNQFSAGDNSRVTRFGKFLRKTKLDEIPQLINVLKGDMSIVGPRPEVVRWTEVYSDKWKIVHSVKPGITDNASIEFRNEEEMLAQSDDPIKTYRDVILPRKLDLYIDYVNNQSFWGDLKIIFKTIKVVILK